MDNAQGVSHYKNYLMLLLIILLCIYVIKRNIFAKSKLLFAANLILIAFLVSYFFLSRSKGADTKKKIRPISLRKKLLLLLVALLFFFAIAETVFRIIDYRYEQWLYHRVRYPGVQDLDNAILGYSIKSALFSKTPFTDEDFNIVFLGDSVTQGYGVGQNYTFVSLLNARLNKIGSNKKFNVVNMAVNAYSSLQEAEFFKLYGLKYKPDLVVIGYVLNDPIAYGDMIDFFTRKTSVDREAHVLKYISAPFRCRVKNFLKKSKFLDYVVLSGKKYQFRISANPAKSPEKIYYLERNPKFYLGIHRDACSWRSVSFSFEEIAGLAEQHNFKVLVVIFPVLFDARELPAYPLIEIHDVVSREAQANGFEVLDMFPVFNSHGINSIKLNNLDSLHPNKKGHEITAEAIYKALINKNIIQNKPGAILQ